MSENKELLSESILFSADIMEKIFSYLNVRDLRRAAGVCWCWRNTAKMQLSMRNTIESLLLPLWITPYNDGYCFLETEFFESYNSLKSAKKAEEPDLTNAKWHLSDVVRCVPKIFLVFYDANTETEYPFCYEYMASIPKSALWVEASFMRLTVDETELYGDTNLGAGISIPWTPHLQCETLDINEFVKDYYNDYYDEEFASYFIGKSLTKLQMSSTTTNEYNCFILFLNRGMIDCWQWHFPADKTFETYINLLLKGITKRFKSGTYALLGTGCRWVTNSLLENVWLESNFSYLMRIHGSALKSWSIVIDIKLSSTEGESKLLDFKKKVQVNSSTFALCSYPVNKDNSRSGCIQDNVVDFVPTEIFKRVFPTVTLTCFYDDQDFAQFGCNTLDSDGDSVFKYEKSLIYLLITTK